MNADRLALVESFADDAIRLARQHGITFEEGGASMAAVAELMDVIAREPEITDARIDALKHELIARTIENAEDFPLVVCLCGPKRFYSEYQMAAFLETMAGRVVISPVFAPQVLREDDAVSMAPQAKRVHDDLHLKKVDLADEILVIDVDGVIGQTTRDEIAFAHRQGKPVRYWSKGEFGSHPLGAGVFGGGAR